MTLNGKRYDLRESPLLSKRITKTYNAPKDEDNMLLLTASNLELVTIIPVFQWPLPLSATINVEEELYLSFPLNNRTVFSLNS